MRSSCMAALGGVRRKSCYNPRSPIAPPTAAHNPKLGLIEVMCN